MIDLIERYLALMKELADEIDLGLVADTWCHGPATFAECLSDPRRLTQLGWKPLDADHLASLSQASRQARFARRCQELSREQLQQALNAALLCLDDQSETRQVLYRLELYDYEEDDRRAIVQVLQGLPAAQLSAMVIKLEDLLRERGSYADRQPIVFQK
jgi:hypothetical protein